MKFKIDENITSEAAEILIAAGHHAMTVGQQAMSGADDGRLSEVCAKEGRAILTADLDFADVRDYPPASFPGFVVLRLKRQSQRAQLEATRRLLPLLSTLPLAGRLWIVDERRVRVRGGDD